MGAFERRKKGFLLYLLYKRKVCVYLSPFKLQQFKIIIQICVDIEGLLPSRSNKSTIPLKLVSKLFLLSSLESVHG